MNANKQSPSLRHRELRENCGDCKLSVGGRNPSYYIKRKAGFKTAIKTTLNKRKQNSSHKKKGGPGKKPAISENKKKYAEESSAGKSSSKKTSSEKSAEKRSSAKKISAEKSAKKRSSAKKISAEKSAEKRSSAKKSSAERLSAKRSSSKKTSAGNPSHKKNKRKITSKIRSSFSKITTGMPVWLQILMIIIILSLIIVFWKHYFLDISSEQAQRILNAQNEIAGKNGVLSAQKNDNKKPGRPEIIQDFLTKNNYSRSGIKIGEVNGIVIHYVANPGSSAKENRDYFEGLKDNHATKASSHYIVGLEGEIIQCIPLNEISYASNNRNSDTISIECCHLDDSGKFNQGTYRSLVKLVSWLCYTYGLDADDVIRHYDVTGKLCPIYYVKHEDAWKEFKEDISCELK